MKKLLVQSRKIKSVYFSQEDGQLRINFRNGEERLFVGVSEDQAHAMVEATSPGQHYIDHIRTRFVRLAA
jgi:hypothetical protein